ncbi:GNAT family N-acetyltransferase [Microbacterium sp. JZ31]|uniref:GNAT family N-acetyltransferase n=1 Tax=Microbacterium sp. JZ31 TaxID=1906274 RepID=UPI0019333FBA|nr:GNAT family N-acetyltransferase [Microbacterium sp. JZ31]
MSEYEFSDDASRLDAEWIHRTLATHSYWARGRPRELQDAANAGSRCFGVYDGERQVAFARLVTDGATFGWLADVIVDPDRRGEGIGKLLVAGVAAEVDRLGLRRTLLKTDDAHTLYERHGWEPATPAGDWLVRERP